MQNNYAHYFLVATLGCSLVMPVQASDSSQSSSLFPSFKFMATVLTASTSIGVALGICVNAVEKKRRVEKAQSDFDALKKTCEDTKDQGLRKKTFDATLLILQNDLERAQGIKVIDKSIVPWAFTGFLCGLTPLLMSAHLKSNQKLWNSYAQSSSFKK